MSNTISLSVPPLPTCFVPRPGELARLQEAVLDITPGPVTLTGAASPGYPFGPHGTGKSVLAAALARNEQVQRAFPDGIFWLPMGRRPPLTLLQASLSHCWTGRPYAFANPQIGLAELSRLSVGRSCLLVLDDVDRLEDIEAFALTEPSVRLLIVTRDVERIAALGVQEVRLRPTDETTSMAILAAWAGQAMDICSAEAVEVMRLCAGLPLALTMAGGVIVGGEADWAWLRERLRQIEPGRLRAQFPTDPYPDLLRVIGAAFDSLSAPLRTRCIDLAVFPPLAVIPTPTLVTWWTAEGADELTVNRELFALARQGWLLPATEDGWHVHPLIHEFIRKYVPNFPELHARLLNAHRPLLPARPLRKGISPWSGLPATTPYLWTNLAYHLTEARQGEELGRLAFDFGWIQARIEQGDLDLLLDDYSRLAQDAEVTMVRQAILDAMPVLLTDPTQLPGQLVGRLDSSLPNVRELVRQTTRWRGGPWLYPMRATLTPPGGLYERRIDLDEGQGRALDVTADGRYALIGLTNGRLMVWDLDLGFTVRAWDAHRGVVNDVAALPGGRYGLSASDDGTLRLWALETGKEIAVLQGHTYGINAVAVLPNGQRAVSASADGTLKVWDIAVDGPTRRRELLTLKGHGGPVWAVVALPDGRLLSGGSDGTIRLWDVARGVEVQVWTKHSGEVYALAVTPDGRYALSGAADETVRVWDVGQGRLLHTLKGHVGPVRALAVTPDGLWGISASDDGTPIVWDLERGVKRCDLSGHQAAVRALAVTWQGRAVSAADDRTLRIWRVEAELHTLNGHRDAVRGIAVLPDGRRYLTVSDDRLIKMWNIEWRRGPLRVLGGHRHDINALALFDQGRRAVTASRDRTLKVWDVEQGVTVHTLNGHNAPVKTVVVLADGVRAVSGDANGLLKVWDLQLGREAGTLGRHTEGIAALAVVGNEQILAASEDGALQLWDVPTAQAQTLREHGPVLWALAAEPGRAFAGGADGELTVWDLSTRAVTRTWHAHEAQVTALALIAGRQRLVSCSADRTLCVWDIARHQSIARFTAEGPLLACAVGPDGSVIVVGEKSGRVHLLGIQEEKP